jgi:putative NADH-flavin reductase
MKKKIALFGASGQTGQHFLKAALENGFEVKALVRDPTKITQNSDQLNLIKGEVLNLDDVRKVVEGADIVVSLFGQVKDSPEWLQTNGTKNIVQAMKEKNVKRIISLSGGALPFPEKDEPKLIDKFFTGVMKMVASKILNDAIKHHEVLKNSGLNWTIVRGPRLTNDPRKGTYRVGWVGVNASTKISRADLADFILTLVEDERFNFQMPFVSI